MAPVFKLKYFNYMGLAEPIKYMFAYGSVQYENVVVPDAEWVRIQKMVPFSNLPILEVDGKFLWNSVAISQYLGKMVGLFPSDDFEVAEMNAIAEVVYELGLKVLNWHLEVHQEWKPIVWKELEEVIIPKYFYDFEEILKKKGTFFGGKKMNWVDIYFTGVFEFIEMFLNKPTVQKQWPALYQMYSEVKNAPAIKAYISKRPAYKY